MALPGKFITPTTPLFWTQKELPSSEMMGLADTFVYDDERAFAEDPRFCVEVMIEIACRALSHAINDVGTCIDVIGRAVRVLSLYANKPKPEVRYDKLWVLPVSVADLFDDVFNPVSRDSSAILEIQMRLQRLLYALYELNDPEFQESAYHYSQLAWMRAEESLPLEEDRKTIRSLVIQKRPDTSTVQNPAS